MLDIIILLGAGSAITLYFVNTQFRNMLHALGRHVVGLFRSGDEPPATPAASTPDVVEPPKA